MCGDFSGKTWQTYYFVCYGRPSIFRMKISRSCSRARILLHIGLEHKMQYTVNHKCNKFLKTFLVLSRFYVFNVFFLFFRRFLFK